MSARVLMSGNDAVGEGAIRAGCDCYFGYPITPQNELTAYMASQMPRHGRVFVQAESELAAINMVYGAAAAGKRTMTSSSSPGISLKQEGISYIAAAELPAVIVNIQRGGPGLGNIAPSQADYFQATRGGGHGDYHCVVLAPGSVQEMHDLTREAFGVADAYRSPVIVLADGQLGQMMEPVALSEESEPLRPEKGWALTGAAGRKANWVRSLLLPEGELEALNVKLQGKYAVMQEREVRVEHVGTEDCEVLLVAYGTSARVSRGAMEMAREAGIRAGLLRLISLWPFPYEAVWSCAERARGVVVVEMSAGQMLQDVDLAVKGRRPVVLENRLGGGIPAESDVLRAVQGMAGGKGARQ